MRPPPKPWRGRCPVCKARSKGGYETEMEATGWGDAHLLRRHYLRREDIEAAVGHPVPTCIYMAKE